MQLPSTFRRWVADGPSQSFREAAVLKTVPLRQPTSDEVLVRTKYATINGGHDNFVARREVFWDKLTGSVNLGADSLSEIIEVGSAVTSFKVGDYVTCIGGGAYGEYSYPLESKCDKVDSPKMEYAALRVNGTLVCGMLEFVCKLDPGNTLLVTAAAGGVGHLAVQLGKLHGCHVIGVCGGIKKKEVVTSLGADRVVNYHEESLEEVLREEYPHGIDYVVENVGGHLMKNAFDNLAPNGKLLSIGYISQYPHVSTEDQKKVYETKPGYPTLQQFLKGRENIMIGEKQLIKQIWPEDPKTRSLCRSRAIQLFKEDKWKVLIDHYALSTFVGLESIPDSVDYMLSGNSIGKILTKIND